MSTNCMRCVIRKRTGADLLCDECRRPWWYLSFADDDAFRGAAIVQAATDRDALARCTAMGINPGGKALILKIPASVERAWPTDMRGRLIGREELAARLHGRELGDATPEEQAHIATIGREVNQ